MSYLQLVAVKVLIDPERVALEPEIMCGEQLVAVHNSAGEHRFFGWIPLDVLADCLFPPEEFRP